MTENQKSWVFAVALAMVFVSVSCVSVASAYEFGSDVAGADIYISVPYGYFSGVVPYSGSVDVGSGVRSISVSWGDTRPDNTAEVSLYSDSSRIFYGVGYTSSTLSFLSLSAFELSSSTYHLSSASQPTSLSYWATEFTEGGIGESTSAGSYSLYYLSSPYGPWERFSSGDYDFTIPSVSPITPTPTPTPTSTTPAKPVITSFEVMPTFAYPYVSLGVTLVGTGGTSAYITRSDVSPNVDLTLQDGTTDTWVNQISFSAPGDYQVQGYLVGPGGTSSTSVVTVHIIELPNTPVIHNTSITYDMGYDHPVITTYVTYPTGVYVQPDTCFYVTWGDGSTSYYEGFNNDGFVPLGYPTYIPMHHVYTSDGIYTATVYAQNAGGTVSADVGISIFPDPEPTATTPEPTVTTPEPTVTTPEPTVTTPEPTITTPAPTGTYPTPTYTIPTPITTVVIPTYDLDPSNPLGLGIASPGGEPPAPPAFPALVLPNLNILAGWGQNTSWSGLYDWYDGVVNSIVDPLGSAWADLMAPLVQYVVDVSAGVTSLFFAISTWIYPAVAFAWEVSGYIYALVPLVVWICIAAILWILVLALLMRLLSEPVWMIIRDLFGGRR